MLYDEMGKELKSLEEVTNKSMRQLVNYYHKCYQKIERPSECSTEFEFNEFESKANDMIVSFIRDYALFDIDESNLLKDYKFDNDDMLFNCCSPYRL